MRKMRTRSGECIESARCLACALAEALIESAGRLGSRLSFASAARSLAQRVPSIRIPSRVVVTPVSTFVLPPTALHCHSELLAATKLDPVCLSVRDQDQEASASIECVLEKLVSVTLLGMRPAYSVVICPLLTYCIQELPLCASGHVRTSSRVVQIDTAICGALSRGSVSCFVSIAQISPFIRVSFRPTNLCMHNLLTLPFRILIRPLSSQTLHSNECRSDTTAMPPQRRKYREYDQVEEEKPSSKRVKSNMHQRQVLLALVFHSSSVLALS